MRVLAQKYLDLGEALAEARTVFQLVAAAQETGDTGSGHLKPEEIEDLRETLRDLKRVCSEIPLPVTYEILRKRIADPPQSVGELDVIVDAAKAEFESALFVRVPQERSLYYEHDGLLAPATRTAFPRLTVELRSAGNAYAFGLPTACVFHCMRALENAIAAMAADVGITWTKEQWHNIIDMIEAQIERERKTLPRGIPRDERLNFLSLAAKELFYFKDGWRNYVAHNKVDYQEAQALQTLEHVKAFADNLATNLTEYP